MGNSNAQILV